MKASTRWIAAALALSLAGCAGGFGKYGGLPPPPREPGGTVPEEIGMIAGTGVGGTVGRDLTSRDRRLLQELIQRGLETGKSGKTLWWRNDASGHSGTITPQPHFTMGAEGPCREFQQTITASGESATGYGTACRAADGTWRLAKSG